MYRSQTSIMLLCSLVPTYPSTQETAMFQDRRLYESEAKTSPLSGHWFLGSQHTLKRNPRYDSRYHPLNSKVIWHPTSAFQGSLQWFLQVELFTKKRALRVIAFWWLGHFRISMSGRGEKGFPVASPAWCGITCQLLVLLTRAASITTIDDCSTSTTEEWWGFLPLAQVIDFV